MFNIKKIGKNHTLPYYYIIYSFTCYTSDIFNYPKKKLYSIFYLTYTQKYWHYTSLDKQQQQQRKT